MAEQIRLQIHIEHTCITTPVTPCLGSRGQKQISNRKWMTTVNDWSLTDQQLVSDLQTTILHHFGHKVVAAAATTKNLLATQCLFSIMWQDHWAFTEWLLIGHRPIANCTPSDNTLSGAYWSLTGHQLPSNNSATSWRLISDGITPSQMLRDSVTSQPVTRRRTARWRYRRRKTLNDSVVTSAQLTIWRAHFTCAFQWLHKSFFPTHLTLRSTSYERLGLIDMDHGSEIWPANPVFALSTTSVDHHQVHLVVHAWTCACTYLSITFE